MSAELVICRCRALAPANPDHHGTAPDGRLVERSAVPPCDLCGGSGRTTPSRLRASAASRALALLGLGAAGLAVLCWIARIALVGRGVAAAALASLAVAGLLELYLARTARRDRD
jgi:hypothetical protein